MKKGGPMKRSAFRRPSFEELKAKGERIKPALGKGKKVKAWDATRADLKPDFQARGITSCEIKLPGCWRDNGLGFAHTKKRRNVVDLRRVVLACNVCHDYWEAKPESEMEAALEAIITERGLI